MSYKYMFAIALTAAFISAAQVQGDSFAFVGADIIPIVPAGKVIKDGVLVINDDKIAAVGARNQIQIPNGAKVIDVTGQVIMPGLVDTHSHIGGLDWGERAAPINPDMRILDTINPFDPGFRRAVAGGLTTVNIMPGSGHLLSGQTIYVKARRGKTIDDLYIYDKDGNAMGGIKMANGTNPQDDPPFPGTRAKAAALVREKYIKAIEYREKIERAGDDPEKMPDRDLGLEALVEVLDGKRIVHHHTHRADDIMTVLRLSKEIGFRVVLHHVSEAWKIADEIAEANVPCSVILVDSPGGKLEAAEVAFKTGRVLDEAGVLVAYHTDDWITDSRLFFRCAALGVRAGLSRETALESLTINGAKMLDLEDRVGSLEVGKDADFIILDGDPLSTYTKVLETWIDGTQVFNRSDEKDYLYAVGGYGAGKPIKPYMCCYDHTEGN